MYKKRKIELFIISIPILILLMGSVYFGYVIWKQYKNDINLQQDINKGTLLQSIEHSIVNELVCFTIVDQENKSRVCGKIRKTTDNLILQLQEQPLDPYITFYNTLLGAEENDGTTSLLNKLKVALLDIRSSDTTVENVINGAYQKNIINLIQTYLINLETYSNIPKEKELLQFFSRLLAISYSAEAEKNLIAYYLSSNLPVSSTHLIYWDELIWSSEFPDISREKDIVTLQTQLLDIFSKQKLETTLKGIEDIRISILSNVTTGNYSNTPMEWVNLLNQKQKALNLIETMVLDTVLNDATVRIKEQKQKLLTMLILFFLSLFFLFYLIRYSRTVSRENRIFNETINTIESLSISQDETVLVTPDVLKNKEDAYTYIETQFKKLDAIRQRSTDENNAKDFYLTNMSHEIRTPINGISGFIRLLKETSLSEEQNEFINLMETSTKHLTTIVGDVLDIAKINAKKMDIERVSFDIFDNIESIVSGFGVEADKKDITLGLFVDPELPSHLISDPSKLTHIFTNLIGNALKFTNEYGTIDISVELLNTGREDVKVKFNVSDSGIGLSEKQKEKIFKPFDQADISTSRKYGGTGLGLTIAQRMIGLMGGTLDVESQEGKGSNFYFTLKMKIDTKNSVKLYPSFEGIKAGLALPIRNLDRQVDTNLEKYLTYLGASFKIYYYDEIFSATIPAELPDLMIIYHNYARLEGELESFTELNCKTVLITTASLRLRIGQTGKSFSDIVYMPMTINKTIRMLRNVKLDNTKVLPNNKSIFKFQNIKALVAEDNFINQKLIRILLENLGLEVELVSNGAEAVHAHQEKNFDLIFMDIHMPVVDGVEATKMILEFEELEGWEHTPIIALTGHIKKGDREKYLHLGLDEYLTKPIKIEEIKKTIGEYFPDNIIRK